MRSILRSSLLASFALGMTLVISGCEDTTKPTPPPATAGEAPKPAEPPKEKMEGPAATPPVEKAATPPVEPPK